MRQRRRSDLRQPNHNTFFPVDGTSYLITKLDRMKNYAIRHFSLLALNYRQLHLTASEWFFKHSYMSSSYRSQVWRALHHSSDVWFHTLFLSGTKPPAFMIDRLYLLGYWKQSSIVVRKAAGATKPLFLVPYLNVRLEGNISWRWESLTSDRNGM